MFSLLLSLALAGDTVATPTETDAAEEKKMVCKSVKTLGTRIPQRVCRSSKEWAKINEAQKRQLETRSNQSRGTQGSN
ncbi:hypothetical protein SAMN02745824_2767 [Parasphingorhabdus marina DSM 22363]|uniref:Uncharacterized protein n=1 Tax=Parasphingorhabdus marina DSM 22363 TaxID=1123272 RepID=A0A1N6GCA7_9SPHN|nr:hypothetical protein [Parasphingorhabdus marina]SIO05165.1 hypothetical protein SAMN02745824_2767 [Parasphingorhabdus marina DSM 22363]